MIIITGDVHTKIQGSWEQGEKGSELICAEQYLAILKKYKLSSTLFINGKCLDQNPDQVKKLLNFNVELGGHTYENFGNMGLVRSYINRKLFGCVYGSSFYQKKDIKKTKLAFSRLGLSMTSWRTHAFSSNNNTFNLLRKAGVKYISDLFGEPPFEQSGIIHVPITMPPDNNALEYGPNTPKNRDPFIGNTKGRIKPEEWFELIKKRVISNEKQKKISVFLMHPVTMANINNFQLFEKVCKFLSNYKSIKISELKI